MSFGVSLNPFKQSLTKQPLKFGAGYVKVGSTPPSREEVAEIAKQQGIRPRNMDRDIWQGSTGTGESKKHYVFTGSQDAGDAQWYADYGRLEEFAQTYHPLQLVPVVARKPSPVREEEEIQKT